MENTTSRNEDAPSSTDEKNVKGNIIGARPNILFILTDQQRYDALGCRGGTPAITPNLDRLASQSVRFEHCYTQCPLCVPARWSLLTGQYVHNHRVFINEHPLNMQSPTWPESLQNAGYKTLALGKTHGVHKGFSRVAPPYEKLYDLQSGPRPGMDEPNPQGGPPAPWPHGKTVANVDTPKEKFFDFQVAEQASDELKNLAKSDNPWAMFVGVFYPHPPYIVPKPFSEMFDPAKMPLPQFNSTEIDTKTAGQKLMYERHWKDVNADRWREIIAGYWACVAMADACIGRILDELDRLELADDTLVVLTSDHGDLNGEHGMASKFTSCYDAEARVPLIIRWPGKIPAGKISQHLVESIDVIPTILHAANAKDFDEDAGRSLWPILEDPQNNSEHRRYVTSVTGWLGANEIRPQGYMLRTRTHKLVYYPEDRGELYDIASDPRELQNLWDVPQYEHVREELLKMLLQHLASTIRHPIC